MSPDKRAKRVARRAAKFVAERLRLARRAAVLPEESEWPRVAAPSLSATPFADAVDAIRQTPESWRQVWEEE